MARIDEARYESMISELNSFASKIGSSATELQSISSTCISAIGSDDKAVPTIVAKINLSVSKYMEAAADAKSIAQKMQEELDEQRREDQEWQGED